MTRHEKTAFLICEGRCNGGVVQAFDEYVQQVGRIEVGNKAHGGGYTEQKGLTTLSNSWSQHVRAWRYTAHRFDSVHHSRQVYVCAECGQRRIFGYFSAEPSEGRVPVLQEVESH